MSEVFKVRCIFDNPELKTLAFGSKRNDSGKCSGEMTEHHVQYWSEGGPDTSENLVPMCEGHQKYIHGKENEWKKRENGDSPNGGVHTKLELEPVLR